MCARSTLTAATRRATKTAVPTMTAFCRATTIAVHMSVCIASQGCWDETTSRVLNRPHSPSRLSMLPQVLVHGDELSLDQLGLGDFVLLEVLVHLLNLFCV